jgi:hypothetical protein
VNVGACAVDQSKHRPTRAQHYFCFLSLTKMVVHSFDDLTLSDDDVGGSLSPPPIPLAGSTGTWVSVYFSAFDCWVNGGG